MRTDQFDLVAVEPDAPLENGEIVENGHHAFVDLARAERWRRYRRPIARMVEEGRAAEPIEPSDTLLNRGGDQGS